MDQSPLVMQEIEAGSRFIQEFAKHTPVQAAFWLKARDESQWFLYVASDRITDSNLGVSYGEVLRIASEPPDPWLDPFQIKVIGTDHPLAKAVLEIQAKYPRSVARRLQSRLLGGLSIDDAYIYPLPVAAAT